MSESEWEYLLSRGALGGSEKRTIEPISTVQRRVYDVATLLQEVQAKVVLVNKVCMRKVREMEWGYLSL